MRKIIKFVLLIAVIVPAACTNHETDEDLELLTPNEPAETVWVSGADTFEQAS